MDKYELWSDSELNDLGYALKSYITSRQAQIHHLNAKIIAIDERMLGFA